jgi:hypothetical protein
MNAPTKIAGFVAVLASVFCLALAVGNSVGPIGQHGQVHNASHTETERP